MILFLIRDYTGYHAADRIALNNQVLCGAEDEFLRRPYFREHELLNPFDSVFRLGQYDLFGDSTWFDGVPPPRSSLWLFSFFRSTALSLSPLCSAPNSQSSPDQCVSCFVFRVSTISGAFLALAAVFKNGMPHLAERRCIKVMNSSVNPFQGTFRYPRAFLFDP